MSKLEDLESIVETVTFVQSLSTSEKRSYFQNHSDKKRLFYRHHKNLEQIHSHIEFEHAWRHLLSKHQAMFSDALVVERFAIAKNLIEDKLVGTFKARRVDVTTYLAELFAGEKSKRHRVESQPDSDLSPLKRLQKHNPLMEKFQSYINLDDFDVERTIGLGYLTPYPKTQHLGHPGQLRFRLDILVLKGPWHNILLSNDNQGAIQQQVFFQVGDQYEERFQFIPLGSADTHHTGLILLQMSPCFYAHEHHDDEYLFPCRKDQDWNPEDSFDRDALKEQIERIDIGALDGLTNEIPEQSPFHPSNLKRTIEREFEYIFSSQQRIAFWSSLEVVSYDAIHPYLKTSEYIKRYANLYKFTPPKPPPQTIQDYLQHHYKQDSEVAKLNPSVETQNMFKVYKGLGFTHKTILLSPFFVYEDAQDLDFQICNALVNPMIQILQYQMDLYNHLFKPEDIHKVHLIQPSLNRRAFPQSWDAHRTCFARLRFEVLDSTYKDELFNKGATFIVDDGASYVDVYGLFPNFHPDDRNQLRLTWQGLVEAALPRDTVHKALLSNIENEIEYDFSQIQPLCNWDETTHFSTIQLNTAYWSEEEQSKLWTHERIHEYLKNLGYETPGI